MRVLHLLPEDAQLALRVRALVRAEAALGLDAWPWPARPDDPADALALWQSVTAAQTDILHSHRGALPLTWAPALDAALITTLHAPPTAADRRAFESADPAPILVAACAGLALPVRRTVGDDLAAAAGDYVELYEAVCADHRARRIDGTGDERPWGRYRVLDDQPEVKVKRIEVLPGKRLSYQRHAHRSEHWLVVGGRARVTLDGRELLLGPGDGVAIPAGAAHRIENVGDELVIFVEVQRGTYFGEDDIERLEDDYGRAPA